MGPEPLGKKPFRGGDENPLEPEDEQLTPQQEKTEGVMRNKRGREEEPEAAPTDIGERSAKVLGIEDMPPEVLQRIAGKLHRPVQHKLLNTSEQLQGSTAAQIFHEELEPLNQLLNLIKQRTNIVVPRPQLSGSLATLNQEFITYRDTVFIPAMITAMATMDEESFEALAAGHEGPMPSEFDGMFDLLRSYLVLLGRSHRIDLEDCFLTLQEFGGFAELQRGVAGELQRGVEVAYQHVDDIENPDDRNRALYSITRWDLEAFLNKELTASIVHPGINMWLPEVSYKRISAKLELITAKFEHLINTIEKISAPADRLHCLYEMTGFQALIYHRGGLKEMSEDAYLRAHELLRQHEETIGADFTTDQVFYRHWIEALTAFGEVKDARAMAQSLPPDEREEMLQNIEETLITIHHYPRHEYWFWFFPP